MAGIECGSYNNPRGAAVGQSANYVNNTAPVSATLSNTAAGYTTLGGQFQFAAVAGAETDYALFAFQVPVAAAGGGNRNLVIRGVRIETFNMGAASATTFNLGAGALQRSTLRRKVNREEHADVPAELMKWVWAGGRKLKGLVKRRKSEGLHYAA